MPPFSQIAAGEQAFISFRSTSDDVVSVGVVGDEVAISLSLVDRALVDVSLSLVPPGELWDASDVDTLLITVEISTKKWKTFFDGVDSLH